MKITSRDGTTIAFDVQGAGPALILVDGALTTRRSQWRPELVALLAPHFTVYGYDRRGRGESTDTKPYAVEREIDDIDELIGYAGGRAFLHGQSSGGCLALLTARELGPGRVAGVASYEAPWNDDPTVQPAWSEYLRGLDKALANGRRGDAVALFMRFVGNPPEQVDAMRDSPYWPSLEALAPTLAYDHAGIMSPIIAVPRQKLAQVTAPAVAICGGQSPAYMCATARTISETVRHGAWRTIAGQRHAVEASAIAPVLIESFGAMVKDTRAA